MVGKFLIREGAMIRFYHFLGLIVWVGALFATTEEPSPVGIRRFDAIEFYVGSAKAVAYWHAKGMGCDLIGYSGPETGVFDRASYYLKKGDLKVVVTSATTPANDEICRFVTTHGDGIKKISYEVDDVQKAYDYIFAHGGIPIQKPHRTEDDRGFVEKASFKLYDDTEILLVNYDHYEGIFLPGFAQAHFNIEFQHEETGLERIDHIVGNVRQNEMDLWVNYFRRAFDFETFVDFGPGDITTEYSALLSKVVRSKDSAIKHPVNEPYFGLKKSQIEEYLEQYRGSGVQHVAIQTKDIVKTVDALRKNGIEFLEVPDTYYSALAKHKDRIQEEIADLKRLKILCDLEGTGYLLQIFTKPTGVRPTFFYEIIQRVDGAQGFGKGNFQALFEAIEKEQALRGNL